jgi:hypothetical protein
MFGSIFYEGEGRGGNIEQFLLPPNWGDLEGRGGEASHIIAILIILTFLTSYLL